MRRIVALAFLILGAATAFGQSGRLAKPGWVPPGSDQTRPDVIVYYFHNTVRCATCRTMEAEAESVLRDEFADDVTMGTVVFRPRNLQNPENAHFARLYGLDGPSLVLVEVGPTDDGRWRKLGRIWELVDTPAAYRKYVRDEIEAFLDGRPAPEVSE